ncbi:MAG: hypothetical protein CL431_10315 [Acidimicrobiaceae bacterium]|jgi:uncharacterized RDD family membrane protein YckC|nr:hypothetical protein [Acidimicrobiaceae bacterium]|tara:strand:+ start:8203 stop:8721 length:519 start_codon:yes stop_codon:yes gene_type:complete
MYTEQPGWYHAEGDPLDTKRFWNGSEWSNGLIGGEMLWPRFAARLMDSVISGIILFLIALGFGANSVFAITLMSIFVVAIYEIAFVTLKGATPGKMLFRFKVVEASTGQCPPSGSIASMRYAPGLLSVIPFIGTFAYLGVCGISLWWLRSDPDRQTIFDKAGKTFVARVSPW